MEESRVSEMINKHKKLTVQVKICENCLSNLIAFLYVLWKTPALSRSFLLYISWTIPKLILPDTYINMH